MITKSKPSSLFGGLTKFFTEVCSALFVPSDKKDYLRWKDFFAS